MKTISLLCIMSFVTIMNAQTFQWVKQFNGDYTKDVERDLSGNIYVIGDYRNQFTCGSTNFNTPGNRFVIIKYNSLGNCQWVKNRPLEHVESVMDENNDIYLTGHFTGTVNYEGNMLTSYGGQDVYVAKYNSSGDFMWVRQIGGPGQDAAKDIAVRGGHAYVTGYFGSSVQVGANIYQGNGPGAARNFYLAKFASASGNFLWLERATSSETTEGWRVGSDASGNAYVLTVFADDAYYDSFLMTHGGSDATDRAIIKYSGSGAAVWASYEGSNYKLFEENMTADVNGNVYMVWAISYGSVTIKKINTNGAVLWQTSGGGLYSTSCVDIKIDNASNVYMTGNIWPDGEFGDIQFDSDPRGRMYIAKISPVGTFKYVIAAQSNDEPTAISVRALAVSDKGETFTVGQLIGGTGIAFFGPFTISRANGEVFLAKTTEEQLIGADEVWKYLANGSNQGTAWRASSFDDSSWPSGYAELGYGDGDETTVVSYGPNANNKYITTYFRKDFYIEDLSSFGALELSLLRDDGAVVYINGTEVVRSNMPSGTITYTTLAPGFGSTPEGVYVLYNVSKDFLVEGMNTIAVEVHQVEPSSSDMSFNLKLRTTGGPPPDELIAANGAWKYLDNGTNQGTLWKENYYDDAAWQSGNAELGYGDGDETTVVGFGPSASNKYVTTYFRKWFNVNDVDLFTGLELSVIRDDGIRVWINGTEVFRNNLPTGTIGYTTLATTTVDGSAEDAWFVTNISKSALENGPNLIAVEIHQRSVKSSDISFNLKLKTTTVPPPADPDLVSANASWKYLDNGSNQGTAWRMLAYSDASWSTGNAELGYGDGGEATVVSYGPSSTNKYITTYFRKTFNLSGPFSFPGGLELSLIRDDGAVVYINGVEVWRNNMPTGTIAYNTLASGFIDGSAESTWITTVINSNVLVSGTNVIAVEIHQSSASSSDISFNLKLKGLTTGRFMDPTATTGEPENTVAPKDGDLVVYPNPNSGSFTFEFCLNDISEDKITVEILNSLGQQVFRIEPQINNKCVKELIELDNSLTAGVYILNVTLGDRKETKRIVLTD
jgi:hypothetical protein